MVLPVVSLRLLSPAGVEPGSVHLAMATLTDVFSALLPNRAQSDPAPLMPTYIIAFTAHVLERSGVHHQSCLSFRASAGLSAAHVGDKGDALGRRPYRPVAA